MLEHIAGDNFRIMIKNIVFCVLLLGLIFIGCIGSMDPDEDDVYTGPVFINEYIDSNFDYFLHIYDSQIWIHIP